MTAVAWGNVCVRDLPRRDGAGRRNGRSKCAALGRDKCPSRCNKTDGRCASHDASQESHCTVQKKVRFTADAMLQRRLVASPRFFAHTVELPTERIIIYIKIHLKL